jgi:hypothetical protein
MNAERARRSRKASMFYDLREESKIIEVADLVHWRGLIWTFDVLPRAMLLCNSTGTAPLQD